MLAVIYFMKNIYNLYLSEDTNVSPTPPPPTSLPDNLLIAWLGEWGGGLG